MARPVELVRSAPVDPVAVLMTVAVVDALAGALDEAAAGAELAGAAGAAAAVLLLALLHAAASSAAATGTPIFTGIGSRVSIELVMLVASIPGRHNRRATAGPAERGSSSLACRHLVTGTRPKEIGPELGRRSCADSAAVEDQVL